MAERKRNISVVTLDDHSNLSLEEGDQLKKRFSDFQRQQLEKAFKQNQYPTLKAKEDLALSLGASIRQIQTWFQHRRNKWQRENKITVKNPSPSQMKHSNQSIEVPNHETKNSNDNALKAELDLEKIKSAGLSEQLNNFRSQYDNLVFEKNKIAHQLEEERLKNNQLNDKIKILSDLNENLKKNLNAIVVYIKKILP